jgi:hypothetical protein
VRVSKTLSVTFGVGLAMVVVGLVMCFLDGHPWLISYSQLPVFERVAWSTLLVGTVLSIIGSVGVAVCLSSRTALPLGIASIGASLLIPTGLEAALSASVFYVHSWTFSFFVLIFLGVCIGLIFILVGYMRLILRRRQLYGAAKS